MIEQLYNEVLNSLPSSIFLIDKNNEIVYYNESFNKIFKPAKKSGLSLGESINCTTLKGDNKCGEDKNCDTCFLRMLIKDAILNKKKVIKKLIDKKVLCNDEIKNYRILLSVIAIKDDFHCCIMEDITEICGQEVSYFSKRMNIDFNRAKTIQSLMLPELEKLEPLADFAYFYKQNFLVGGDSFDVFKFDDKNFGGYIADVSGSGISGGMLTVYLHDNYPTDILSPAKALETFAKKFNTLKLSEESYITAFGFSVDTVNKKLLVCNAGHVIPALLKRGRSSKVIYLRGKTVSNWYEGISYSDASFNYKSGDMLILMTDGIPDLKIKKNYYTFERAKKIIDKSSSTIHGVLKNIEVDLVEFCKGLTPTDADDSAILVIKLK